MSTTTLSPKKKLKNNKVVNISVYQTVSSANYDDNVECYVSKNSATVLYYKTITSPYKYSDKISSVVISTYDGDEHHNY